MTGTIVPALVSPSIPSTCTAEPDVTVIRTLAAPAGGDGNQSAITSRVIFLPAVPAASPCRMKEVFASELLLASSSSILMPESEALGFCTAKPLNLLAVNPQGNLAEKKINPQEHGITRFNWAL